MSYFNYYNPGLNPDEEELQAQRTAKAWQEAPDVGGGLGGAAGAAVAPLLGMTPQVGASLGKGLGVAGGDLISLLFGSGAQKNADQLEAERQQRLAKYQADVLGHQEHEGDVNRALQLAIQAA